MEAWRIAVLCVMIAVTLLAIIALLLFCRFKIFAQAFKRAPSPDSFHFYDFSKPRQLRTLTLSNWEGKPFQRPQPSERGRDVSGMSVEAFDLHKKDHFLVALAAVIGDPEPYTLAISRLDPGNLMVELDLNDFLSVEKRDDHMRSTAIVPCALSRHFGFDGVAHYERALHENNISGVYGPQSSHFAPSRVMSAQYSVNNSVMTTPRGARLNDHSVLNLSTPPRPIILPISPNITTNTPITISAALYRFADSPHNSAHNGNVLADLTVPSHIAERLEQLMLVEKSSGTFAVGPTATATVNARGYSATVQFNNGGPARPVRRDDTNARITYSFDGLHEQKVYDPSQPLYLPSGRWSLCAKVYSANGVDFCSSSKVFTVEGPR